MYERVEECPICGHTEFSNFLICNDHLVTDESFAIVQCNNCGLKLTNPRPTSENLYKYYDSPNYDSHKEQTSSLVDIVYNLARKFALSNKLGLINSLSPDKGHLLDVGCGTGAFIEYCSNNRWDVTGIENVERARSIAEKTSSAKVFSSLDEVNVEKEFEVITLWHVLEHLGDLQGTLNNLRKALKKDGHVLIAVPNSDSWDCEKYREMWAGYDVPRHLFHFNQLTISKLAKECRFRVTGTIPMKLDAFYVSLLSEKYIHGRNRLLKAFISGWKSNRWAKKNQNNYSSLIYILSKK